MREFYSVTGGRMLARLAESRAQLRWLLGADGSSPSVVDIARIDGRHLESILIDLASLVGLWNESVVHGPAWRFGEVGRRLERAFGVIDGVRGAFGLYEGRGARAGARRRFARLMAPTSTPTTGSTSNASGVVEIVLASNESLVAYRRRHRSDVEFATALQLLVADIHNPRAAASAIRAVRHQADRLGWQFGVETASALLAVSRWRRSIRSRKRSRRSRRCSPDVIGSPVTSSARIWRRRSTRG